MKKFLRCILPILMSGVIAFSYNGAAYAAEADTEYAADNEYEEDIEEAETDAEEDQDYAQDSDDSDAEETDADETEDAESDTEDSDDDSEYEGYTVTTDEDGWPIAPEVLCGSVLMIEANTGATLYSKDIDTQRYPASTTKVLTCLIALERCSLTETVTFSANAVDLEEGATSIDAVEGETMSMKDCLYGLMLPSGNDCAIAIAEHIAGSVEAFADIMNERAAEIGCTNSHFTNPSGLYDTDHYTTASDLCKIAQVAFNNSAFVDIVSHATYTIGATNKSEPRSIENTDYMIVSNSSYYNDSVVGGKTGYLAEAGRCLVTLAKKNGMTVIAVTMFCPTYNGVFTDTEELLDYVFNGFALNNISESESRFTFANDASKIEVDSTEQILMPSSVKINDLDSEIKFTYDMDIDEFNKASEEAGITSKDGRHLYAIIEYSFAGHYLGKMNVFIDDNIVVSNAVFASVKYVSIWWFLLFGVIFFLLVIMAYIGTRKRRDRRRKRKTRVIQTQTPDGQPIPINVIRANDRSGVTSTTSAYGRTTRVRQMQPDERLVRESRERSMAAGSARSASQNRNNRRSSSSAGTYGSSSGQRRR